MHISVEDWVRGKIYSRGGEWVGGERDATVGDDAGAWQQPKRKYLRGQAVFGLCWWDDIDKGDSRWAPKNVVSYPGCQPRLYGHTRFRARRKLISLMMVNSQYSLPQSHPPLLSGCIDEPLWSSSSLCRCRGLLNSAIRRLGCAGRVCGSDEWVVSELLPFNRTRKARLLCGTSS